MKEKVFCRGCKYHDVRRERINEWVLEHYDVCTKNKIGNYDPVDGFKESTVRCMEKNEKMDCKDYEKTKGFWERCKK